MEVYSSIVTWPQPDLKEKGSDTKNFATNHAPNLSFLEKEFCWKLLGTGVFKAWVICLLAWPCNKPFSAPNSDVLVLFGLIVCWAHVFKQNQNQGPKAFAAPRNNLFLDGFIFSFLPVQFSSVAQSCPTLCDLMDCSTPGLPVHHQLLESTQTHVHWVGDAIQLSHPLSSPSPPAFNLSQDQGVFQWVSSSHQVAKVLQFQLQHQSFQWTLSTDLL